MNKRFRVPKRNLLPIIAVTLLLLAACRNQATVPATNAPELSSPTARSSSPSTKPVETSAPTPQPVPEETDSETPDASTPTTEVSPVQEAILPSPTLFPVDWQDRSIFAGGLVPAETAVLQELPGATVYHLSLDITDPNLVSGRMEALYTNQEGEPLTDLVLHLFPAQLGGGMTVSDIRVNGRAASSDQTSGFLRVNLDEALLPGQQVVLSMAFNTDVPGEESTKYKVLAYDEDILTLAHFYPMFAVHDETGWHTLPSPPHGDETFSDASFYLVEVKAPDNQVLVAAGNEVDRQQSGDQQSATFAAGPARDFYLVSSERFGVAQRQVGPVLISSYAPADRRDGAELALAVAADALESFENRYGAYPYSELDIVSTPTDALGVEYPGIFANALRIYDLSEGSSSGLPNRVLLESTTVHETGHQWFYNLIASDQLNEPWLDESLTQFATWQYYKDQYGEQGAEGFYSNLEGRWARAEQLDTPIGLPAAAYSSRDYGPIVYGRGPIFLGELAEEMGQETFDEFLKAYSNDFRWKIATAADFKTLAEAYCQCDLTEMFDEQVFGS